LNLSYSRFLLSIFRMPVRWLLAILLITGSIMSPDFFTARNLANLARQVSIEGILAVAMTLVIVTRGIDLSIESVAALSSMVIVLLLAPLGLAGAMVVAILVGLSTGFLNGIILVRTGASPIIITLGTWITFRGLCLLITGGQLVAVEYTPAFGFMANGDLGPFPFPFLMFGFIVVLGHVFLTRMKTGRSLLAIGGNEEAAHLAGIPIHRTLVMTYMLSGLLAAVAGILLGSRLEVAQPHAAEGFLLNVVAAVVLGGTRLEGGTGSLFGTFLGVLVVGTIRNIFNMAGIPLDYQQLIFGTIILVTIVLTRIFHSRK
jgi:ribose transport system permease protein